MEGGVLETQNSMPMKTQYKHAFSTSAFNCIWTSLFFKQKKLRGECFIFHCVFISFHHSIWKRHASQLCQKLASFLLVQLLRYSSPQLVLAIHEYSSASQHKHSRAAFSLVTSNSLSKQFILHHCAAEETLSRRHSVRLWVSQSLKSMVESVKFYSLVLFLFLFFKDWKA